MAEKKLFLRKATGLVREIGLLTAVIIALANVVGLGWQKRVFQVTGWAPVGTSQFFLGIHPVAMSFFLVGIVVLLSVYCFAVLSAAMPRSGGGYVFISRIINPGLAFVATWLEFWSVAVSYGLIAVAVMEAIFLFSKPAGVDVTFMLTAPRLFIFGTVIVVIFSGIASLGIRQTGRLLHTIFWIPAAILVLVYLLFLTASPASMNAGVQNLYGAAAEAYTQAAINQGLADAAAGNTYWGAVATATIATYWAYIGYAAATFVAGEVKEAHRSLPTALFITGVILVVLYVTISQLMARAAGMAGRVGDFSLTHAIAFLAYGGGSFADAGLTPIGGWMPNVAAIQAYGAFPRAGILFGWLIMIFSALWVANDIPPFILTTSRMVFAMAFDRVMPERLADVDERWHSPVNAIIFVSIVAVIFGCTAEADLFSKGALWLGPVVHAVINPGGGIVATDIWDAIFFTCVALALWFFPTRKPEIFERSPFRQSRATVVTLGVLATIANAILLLVIIFDPHGWALGSALASPTLTGLAPFWFTVLLILVGYGIYWYYQNRAKAIGVDMTTIFAEIPPE